MSNVITEEVIKYSVDNWTIQATENDKGGITYTLYSYPKSGGENFMLTRFDTSELASLKDLIDTALSNSHQDRSKLLS